MVYYGIIICVCIVIKPTLLRRAHLSFPVTPFFPLSTCCRILSLCPNSGRVCRIQRHTDTHTRTGRQTHYLPPHPSVLPSFAHGVPFPGMLVFLFTCHKVLCPSNSLYVLCPLGRFPDCSLFTLAQQKSPFSLQCPHSPWAHPFFHLPLLLLMCPFLVLSSLRAGTVFMIE